MMNELNFLRAISPLHVGSGSVIGVVDLPIQRESHTNIPKIDSSSLKGALRAEAYFKAENGTKEEFLKIFGNNPADKDLVQTGAFSVSESKLLFFPVQSMKNVFSYITCPFVLERFKQTLGLLGIAASFEVPDFSVASNQSLVSHPAVLANDKLVLEEFVFAAQVNPELEEFVAQLDAYFGLGNYFTQRVAVVSNDEFTHFVQHSTELSTRIRIQPETGVVEDGALFYEENLPAESIFFTTLHFENTRIDSKAQLKVQLSAAQVQEKFNAYIPAVFQVGGNASIGRGMINRIRVEGEK